MIPARSDLLFLKTSLFAFTLGALACGSLIHIGNTWLADAEKQLRDAQTQTDTAQQNFIRARDDLDNLSSYATEYAALAERNIVAEEQRLDWVEELEKTGKLHYVMNLKYTISPQQPYVLNPARDTGSMELRLSALSLQMDLLHEMQLMDFFADLRSAPNGWFMIDQCVLERSGAGHESDAALNTGAQLKASCTGGWITLRHKRTP